MSTNTNPRTLIGKDIAALVAVRKDGYLVHWTSDNGSRKTYACADFLSLVSLVERLAKETKTALTWGANGLPRANGLQVLRGFHVYFTTSALAAS